MKKIIVIIYSLIHFLVDLSCAILVNHLSTQIMNPGPNIFIAILIYNFFAFAVQLPIGILADKINKNALCSSIGCIIVAAAFAFTKFGVFSCLIAGIGNAMFHVGGGIDVLNMSNKKATPSGIFVSTGAMGIFLGSKSASVGFNKYYIVIIILILSALLLFWLYNCIKNLDIMKNEIVIMPNLNINEIIAIICLITTVIIRGYVGLILAFEWKSKFILALISTFAVVFGKMLGGIIGDKIGFIKISLLSLLVSAILFIFAFNNSILGILAILFFNMTMPITLIALSNILFNNKGLAFGLLTFALYIGDVPVFFGYTNIIFTPIRLCITSLISAIILYIGIKKYNLILEKNK